MWNGLILVYWRRHFLELILNDIVIKYHFTNHYFKYIIGYFRTELKLNSYFKNVRQFVNHIIIL